MSEGFEIGDVVVYTNPESGAKSLCVVVDMSLDGDPADRFYTCEERGAGEPWFNAHYPKLSKFELPRWHPVPRELKRAFRLPRSFTHFAVVDGVTMFRNKVSVRVEYANHSVTAKPKKGDTIDIAAWKMANTAHRLTDDEIRATAEKIQRAMEA